MELWDAYNDMMQKIPDVTLVRGEEIPEDMFHIVVEVIVRHTDGEYLLMKRDPVKPFGNMWEATAGGSAIKGEEPETAIRRELFEETGIRAEDLRELGRIIDRGNRCLFVDFLAEVDIPKDAIIFQEGETVDYTWVTTDQLLSLSSRELITERMQILVPELKNRRREL